MNTTSIQNEEDKNTNEYNEYTGSSFFELEDNRTAEKIWVDNNCVDKNNYLTSEEYTDNDYIDMYVIKLLNSKNKFNLGTCSTKNELITSLKTDLQFEYAPSNIMCIYTSPKDGNSSGYGSKPTAKIIVKITGGNYFVTLGSVHRILTEPNKIWYALPMFNGKKRRIGNLAGIIGSSMNHGQIPGFIIYKLYTKDEIINRIKVIEDLKKDYPIKYTITNNTLLSELSKDININIFLNKFVKNIIKKCEKLYKQSQKQHQNSSSPETPPIRRFIDFDRLNVTPTQIPTLNFSNISYSSPFNFRHGHGLP